MSVLQDCSKPTIHRKQLPGRKEKRMLSSSLTDFKVRKELRFERRGMADYDLEYFGAQEVLYGCPACLVISTVQSKYCEAL